VTALVFQGATEVAAFATFVKTAPGTPFALFGVATHSGVARL